MPSKIKKPNLLYHYTTIENLGLILKNKKLRFSRIDRVNDLEEANITDIPELKKRIFVSCWTANKNESIPLWHLYANSGKGVRIKLPPQMFHRGIDPYKNKYLSFNVISLLTLENKIKIKDGLYKWIPYLIGPVLVHYKKDNAISVLENGAIKVEKVGTVKLKHWGFEEEYRFLIIPDTLWNQESKRFEPDNQFLNIPFDQEYIYIPLDMSVLNNVEVMLGPKIKKGSAEEIIVDALLKKYTENGKITLSRVKVV